MSKKIQNLFKLQGYIHRETSKEHNLSYNLILNFNMVVRINQLHF